MWRRSGRGRWTDVRRHPQRLAVFSEQAERERLQEKQYLYDTLYTCAELENEHDKAEQVVTELFDFWIENPEELPQGYFDGASRRGWRGRWRTISRA